MKQLLNAENQGIPLYIFDKNGYLSWLNQQTSQVQNWLKQTSYNDEGISLIPNSQGELEQVLFVTVQPKHYFSCGDLIKQLPKGQYLLKAEEQYQDAICFSWLVGSYQFDRYKKTDKSLATLSIESQNIVDKAI
jgi:leucyl aminopeptidase